MHGLSILTGAKQAHLEQYPSIRVLDPSILSDPEQQMKCAAIEKNCSTYWKRFDKVSKHIDFLIN